MNSDSDLFTFIGIGLTGIVNFVFYLIAFFVFLFLARRAKRRSRDDLSGQFEKQYKGFRIATFVSGGVTLLMLLVTVVSLVLAYVLW